ncbi:MAG: ThiF family adenylyltransferase, partial [Clostridia bacterium]|nr:ThiF family adenylyltransferase [Clostridia bacterium]
MKEEYSRTAMLLGEKAVEKLNNSHVIIFGLGGVGSFVAEALSRAGVGALTLVDKDTVSLSNINRQLYALHSTVGRYKTEAAEDRNRDINPDCRV